MNFNFYLLKSFRILLFPFSLLYGLAVIVRNFFFDKNVLKSSGFNLPIICIGNLSVGGTGKSPMVEYVLHLLHSNFKVATLSRGYKRKTSGYALAQSTTNALEIGDEPMQFHLKFPDVAVAVGEARLEAVPQLLHDRPDTQVIILDDAFQHRSIKAGLNILLTECTNLFTRDFYLPTGDLRDQRSSYKRADIILITKCPADFSAESQKKVVKEVQPVKNQRVFFTTIDYGTPYHILTRQLREIDSNDEILLVCGIANPRPLKNFLAEKSKTYYEQMFADHHVFTIDDLNEINERYTQMQAAQKIILTTEKDAVRLLKFDGQMADIPLFVIPVKHRFLFNEGSQFETIILNFINNFTGTKN